MASRAASAGRREREVGQGLQGDELVAAAGASAPAVDGAMAGHGEDPGPEGALVAGEAGEAVHHPQPGLGGQVLARSGGQRVQVAEQAGLQVPPEHAEGSLVAGGGGVEHRREGGADHGRSR
jgi:hypothetical protein